MVKFSKSNAAYQKNQDYRDELTLLCLLCVQGHSFRKAGRFGASGSLALASFVAASVLPLRAHDMAARNIAANMDKHLALRTATHRIELQRFEQCWPGRMKPPKAPGSTRLQRWCVPGRRNHARLPAQVDQAAGRGLFEVYRQAPSLATLAPAPAARGALAYRRSSRQMKSY